MAAKSDGGRAVSPTALVRPCSRPRRCASFLGTIARSMPQFGLLLMLVLLPLQMLSGGLTPRESMPEPVQFVMLAAPTTHFVLLAQAILYRGAGLATVWPQFLALAAIGSVFFGYALSRFRATIGTMA
jgi:ABC-2 type transport system permease protein